MLAILLTNAVTDSSSYDTNSVTDSSNYDTNNVAMTVLAMLLRTHQCCRWQF